MDSTITLQFGDVASAVGNRLWQLQEVQGAYPGDAFHRQERDSNDLIPRALSIGTSGARVPFALSQEKGGSCGQDIAEGSASSTTNETALAMEAARHGIDSPSWEGPLECMQYEISDSWKSWMRSTLPSKNIMEVKGMEHFGLGSAGYGEGSWFARQGSFVELFVDKVRWLAEECDHLHALQALVEEISLFEGVVGEVLPELRDDYPGVPIFLFSIKASQSYYESSNCLKEKGTWRILQGLNAGISNAVFSEHCEIIIPLQHKDTFSTGLKLVHTNDGFFSGSALLASLIDTATLPIKMEMDDENQKVLGAMDYAQLLRGGRPIPYIALGASMPCHSLGPTSDPFAANGGLAFHQQGPFLNFDSLSPVTLPRTSSVHSEHIILRGAQFQGKNLSRAVAEQYLDKKIERESKSRLCSRTVSRHPLYFPSDFPLKFCISGSERSSDNDGKERQSFNDHSIDTKTILSPESASTMISLSSTDAFGPYLSGILNEFHSSMYTARGRVLLESWQIAHGDLEDITNTLGDLISELDIDEVVDDGS